MTDDTKPAKAAKAEPILNDDGSPRLAFPTWHEAAAQAEILGGEVEAIGTAAVVRLPE